MCKLRIQKLECTVWLHLFLHDLISTELNKRQIMSIKTLISIFKSYHTMLPCINPLTLLISDVLHISSNGAASVHQSNKMGLYSLLPGVAHNYNNVWIQDRKKNKLFFSDCKISLWNMNCLIQNQSINC